MNLLPKTHKEFGQAEYWDAFFKKRGEEAFEWYGEYLELCSHLHKYIKNKDKVLVVGCGNSKLSMDLYDNGFKEITNIDISHIVIKKMLEQNKRNRSDMKFIEMDATAMSFSPEEFTVVLDKGTLDALMTDDSEEVRSKVEKYFSEALRVIRNGGRFLCISLLQEHILNFVAEYFPKNNCMLRIVRCWEAEQKTRETTPDSAVMPVFMVVATKFKALPQPIIELNLAGDKMQRLSGAEQLVESVKSVQNAAFVCNGLKKSSIADCNEVVIDLFSPGSNSPRYTVYILDQPPARGNGKYAAFIVHQGRELEWLFSTPKGRKKLIECTKQNRLAIITLHRDHTYLSLQAVKDELADSVRHFAPEAMTQQIPFMTLGDDFGEREVIERGHSEFSGDYVIEEFKGSDGRLLRRLVFLSNQFTVQSEALVKIVKRKNKKETKSIDLSYLPCQYHAFMISGVHLAAKQGMKKDMEVLLIGLGGGGLCSFIHQALKNVKLTAVELDPAIRDVAVKWFDFKEDERLNVVIADGIKYLSECVKSGRRFDAILFDVDGKDPSVGMSCPPQCFVEAETLENVKQTLKENGLFMLNLVCRDENIRDEVVKHLQNTFKSICCYRLEEYFNEVCYCRNDDTLKNLNDWMGALKASSANLNELVRKTKLCKEELIEVEDFIKALKI